MSSCYTQFSIFRDIERFRLSTQHVAKYLQLIKLSHVYSRVRYQILLINHLSDTEAMHVSQSALTNVSGLRSAETYMKLGAVFVRFGDLLDIMDYRYM